MEQQAEQHCEENYSYQKEWKGWQVMDPVTVENRKISVSFSRKVSDGNYGSREATAWVQGDVAPEATVGAISLALGDLFLSAQSAVLDQLGIGYTIDTENGNLVENEVTPAVQAENVVRATFGTSNVTVVDEGAGGGGDIRVMNPADQQGPLPGWLVSACKRDGITAVWDNRSKATGKQPHFKEAVARGGTGHGKDGEPKAFWPPKGN
jgi:hypothetical protein